MDELDLLKKDWQKQEKSYPKLSFDDIYNLIHKKSSSIVKWIFIICVAEFIFWFGLNFFVPESTYEIYEKFHLKEFAALIMYVHYAIILVFMYLFYKNYKSISVTDSTQVLMRSIIKTRRTVNNYVYYNIGLYIILSAVLIAIMYSQPDLLIEVMNPDGKDIDKDQFITTVLIVQVILVIVFAGLFWLYYRLIYGILLKKLNKNYKELATME